ncbi:hypothetical protein [Saliterribacillus persicus]|uniref:Uncharacterized protein n=1 Tax=Saliterribacillus persicus TaxID=930114 RepID=A0A368YAQ0_9BACI|nr:hypothetical protein [Saliterribacillus persicus]RCW77323.1 hypothetical protein DFR57_101194 [Saliterribacillus persicus]
MKKKARVLLLKLFSIIALVITLYFKLRKRNKFNVGYTIYQPTEFKHEIILVDLAQQQVIGKVTYKGKTIMIVFVDVKVDTVQIENDVDELGDLSFLDRESYVSLFKHQAQYLVKNNIEKPKDHFKELTQQSF